jgi:Htaa
LPRSTRLLAASSAVAAAAAFAPAAAPADTVTGGALDWSQTAIYNSASPAGTDRTWLGYVTGSGFLAAGTATPTAPATGPVVDVNSARGGVFTTSFPASRGSYDPSTGAGTIDYDGALVFHSDAHGFTISVEKPEVVLDGLTGKLYASGSGSSAAYDRSAPVYNLDLSAATVTLKADGSRVIGGIVPSLATLNTVFPSNYAVGSGPDRTPNTFGSFALTLRLKPDAAQGPKGDTGATGPTGAPGAAGRNGANGTNGTTIRSVIAILAKAPYKGTTTRRVTVYNGKAIKIAAGTLKGRTLKVTLARSVKALPSTVRVKAAGAKSSTTVKIPS